MEAIREENIKVMDKILQFIINKPDGINWNSIPGKMPYFYKTHLLNILKERNLIKYLVLEEGYVITANQPNASNFITDGGFAGAFKKQKRDESKMINEATLLKWKKNTYWITVLIAVAAFALSLYSVLLG